MEKTSTADMVRDAIKTLGERRGSSLHNIKKYIETFYQVDMRHRAPHIRKFLRDAVGDGGLVQTSGRGASGSFKLPPKQLPSTRTANPIRGPRGALQKRGEKGGRKAGALKAGRQQTTVLRKVSSKKRPVHHAPSTAASSTPRSSPSASSMSTFISNVSSGSSRGDRARARESRR